MGAYRKPTKASRRPLVKKTNDKGLQSKALRPLRALRCALLLCTKQLPRSSSLTCARCGHVGKTKLGLSMHIAQAHAAPVRVSTKSRCLQAKVYRALRALLPEQRREVLGQFTQAQRLSLEQWILAHRAAQTPEKSKGTKCQGASKTLARQTLRRSESQGLRHRGARSDAYASIGPFRLFTRGDTSNIRLHREILEHLKAKVAPAGGTFEGLASALTAAVEALPLTHGLTAAQLCLRYVVAIPARFWISHELLSPRYSGLEACLDAWRRLAAARSSLEDSSLVHGAWLRLKRPQDPEAAWQRLRQAYIDLWVEKGRDRAEMERRLELIVLEHRAKRRCVEPLSRRCGA